MTSTQPATPGLAAVEIHGMSRAAFMVRATLAAGSVYGLGAVTPFVGEALAQSKTGDVDILNFALMLEYLETDFYRSASGLSGEAATLARTFAAEEAAHVGALTEAVRGLGGKPVSKPKTSFPRRSSGLPEARPDARGRRRQRLQRRRTADPVAPGAGRGRHHRPGGGPPCGDDPDAQRRGPGAGRLRQDHDPGAGPERGAAVRDALSPTPVQPKAGTDSGGPGPAHAAAWPPSVSCATARRAAPSCRRRRATASA